MRVRRRGEPIEQPLVRVAQEHELKVADVSKRVPHGIICPVPPSIMHQRRAPSRVWSS